MLLVQFQLKHTRVHLSSQALDINSSLLKTKLMKFSSFSGKFHLDGFYYIYQVCYFSLNPLLVPAKESLKYFLTPRGQLRQNNLNEKMFVEFLGIFFRTFEIKKTQIF